ncbi:hypothetical protein DYH55_08760 [Methylovirgula sp. 4M-Z18]|nr:hypothetical protein DYH55_08760 [Methylovirgula sp. 4M-Z18]
MMGQYRSFWFFVEVSLRRISHIKHMAASFAQKLAPAAARAPRAIGEADTAGLMGDVVLWHDASGAVVAANDRCGPVLGLDVATLLGRGLFHRVHVADRPKFLTLFAAGEAADGVACGTFRLRTLERPNASAGYVEPVFIVAEMRVRHLPQSNVAGAIMVSVLRDVTDAARRREEMESAHQLALRAHQWKDHFLANVSHELRTPLNAIIGFAELLSHEELMPCSPEKQREYARIIHASGEHLLSVVNTILDMSKLESGSLELVPEAIAIAPLVDSCCDMVSLRAAQGGLALVKHLADDLQDMIADRRAVKQILLNLLSNAVKFTPQGGTVTVATRREGASLRLEVRDTGIGMDARDKDRAGSPFFQARASYSRHNEGTGLGLSVVRGLVDLHGGSIAIESAQGIGTSVVILLPLDCRIAVPTKVDTLSAHKPPFSKMALADKPTVKKIA